MSTLAEKILSVPPTQSQTEARGKVTPLTDITMFADDLKIQSHEEQTIQKALDVCTSWGGKYHMRWNTAKSMAMGPKADVHNKLTLQGQHLKTVQLAAYLGVATTASGTTEKECMRRIQNAMKRANMLRAVNVHDHNYTAATMWEIYRSVMVPTATHVVHLSRYSAELQSCWNRIIETILRIILR